MPEAWTGLQELSIKLNKLDRRLAGNVIRKALRKAARPTVLAAKAKAPFKSGLLRAAIKTDVRTNRRRGSISLRIGVSPIAFYGPYLLDRGKTISTRKGELLSRPYKLPAYEFFKTPFNTLRTEMRVTFANELKKEIDKVARNA